MSDQSLRTVMKPGARESGQVAVEAALVMPLFVFLILGILQMGLTAQARVMAKYAAYRAARVGAMNHADPRAIESAAIFHLLPVLVGSSETILPTSSASDVITKFVRHNTFDNLLPSGKQVKTVICGPLKEDLGAGSGGKPLNAINQTALGGRGSGDEIDFDDPVTQSVPANYTADADNLRRFTRMRLTVQIQFLYRMPIPFANWVITRAYLGTNLPSVLMMPNKNPKLRTAEPQFNQVMTSHFAGIHTVPINVSYAMRMQSNFFTRRFPLPDQNECIHYNTSK